MAASMAFPPCSRICTPTDDASGLLVATIPISVFTTERPVTGSGTSPPSVAACSITPCGAQAVARVRQTKAARLRAGREYRMHQPPGERRAGARGRPSDHSRYV